MAKTTFLRSCLLLVSLTLSAEKSFVDTAPTTSTEITESTPKGSPEVVPETLDANVRELESLKQSIGKTIEMMKSQSARYTNRNGHVEGHPSANVGIKHDGARENVEERPSSDAPAGGSLRVDVEAPEESVRESSAQRAQRRDADLDEDVGVGSPVASATERFGNSQYTPLDMAEYVFWTGDEKGVTLAIEEFLQAGLMTREEAIVFLQEIKYNLDNLQKHYNTQLGLNSVGERPKEKTENIADELAKYKQTMGQIEELQRLLRPAVSDNFDLTKLRYEPAKKTSDRARGSDDGKLIDASSRRSSGAGDEELMDRLRAADFLYTEYSLEEVVYQLAKVMFAQGLVGGDAAAQRALRKFAAFLEGEAAQGRISRSLEKKVLDVLIAALRDTLGDRPVEDENRQDVLRRIAQTIPQDKSAHSSGPESNPYAELTKYTTIGVKSPWHSTAYRAVSSSLNLARILIITSTSVLMFVGFLT